LKGSEEVVIEDPYIRTSHQISNFLRFCELVVKVGDCTKLTLVTTAENEEQQHKNEQYFSQISSSLEEQGILLTVHFSKTLHDREVWLSNGWRVRMGRGLDYFQSPAGNYLQIGVSDLDLRPCLETNIDFLEVELNKGASRVHMTKRESFYIQLLLNTTFNIRYQFVE
jgi:ATP-dependent Lon protease